MSDAGEIEARLARLERRADRERLARCAAEGLLEHKSRELYEANQMLSRLAAELEERVEQRTRELADARERALAIADHDQLTCLPNRACFIRELDLAITRSTIEGRRFALFWLDLDRFKEINDTLGHEAGDVFLQQIAFRLRSAAPAPALVARLGGDEFAVIVPAFADEAEIRRIAETMIETVRSPVPYRDRSLEATGSLGVAIFPDHAETASALQRSADIALYRSKVARATHTIYDADMGREIEARHALERELTEAISAGEIEAWFQPIVDATTRRVVGAEALARWRHPTRGILSPTVFVELAEERGLMRDLFARMMRSACPPAQRWIEAGLMQSLSINVSPSQFRFGWVADDVVELVRELGFPPQSLVVEITEEVLMNDLDRARDQLGRLEACGVRIALDDFGTGYSNVGYLRQLPFHMLKLDRSLVADLSLDRKARSILGALVELSRALDLQLVAEGVEEDAQALWLSHIGCRRLQGYLFGRPMPAADMERRIAELLTPDAGPTVNLQSVA